jgi:hypothetical protein
MKESFIKRDGEIEMEDIKDAQDKEETTLGRPK